MKLFLFFLISGIFSLFLILPRVYAAPGSSDGLGCGTGFGPLANVFCGKTSADKDAVTQEAGNQLNRIMSIIVGVMTVGAGLYFLVQLLLAAYGWIGAAADEHQVEIARGRITYGLVGLIIVVAAWIIVGIVGKLLGIDILNPGSLLPALTQ